MLKFKEFSVNECWDEVVLNHKSYDEPGLYLVQWGTPYVIFVPSVVTLPVTWLEVDSETLIEYGRELEEKTNTIRLAEINQKLTEVLNTLSVMLNNSSSGSSGVSLSDVGNMLHQILSVVLSPPAAQKEVVREYVPAPGDIHHPLITSPTTQTIPTVLYQTSNTGDAIAKDVLYSTAPNDSVHK